MGATSVGHVTSVGLIFVLLGVVLSLLPVSPFHAALGAIHVSPILDHLNWICPVKECVAIFQIWVSAMGGIYTVLIGGRLIHIFNS